MSELGSSSAMSASALLVVFFVEFFVFADFLAALASSVDCLVSESNFRFKASSKVVVTFKPR